MKTILLTNRFIAYVGK